MLPLALKLVVVILLAFSETTVGAVSVVFVVADIVVPLDSPTPFIAEAVI